MVWKTAIAKKYKYSNMHNGEDMDWVKRAYLDIKTQHRIDKVLYYYDANYSTTSETANLSDIIIMNNINKLDQSSVSNDKTAIYDCKIINPLDNIYISIVMTTYNRVKQTLLTLDIINKLHINKNYNIQIIIVDDSIESMVEKLNNFNHNIEINYIHINREKNIG
jgi:hypothetical protein